MSEFDSRRVFEIIQKNVTPPGHFQNVLARRNGWLGLFCFDFEGPRWNNLIPVPGEGGERVPDELIDLASDISDTVAVYGETGFVDETVEGLELENYETAFEMTYLVPDDLSSEDSLPDVDFRRTTTQGVRDDFLDLFRIIFGEEQEDGSFEIDEAMKTGVRKIADESELGFDRTSFVGYLNDEPVCIGTLSAKEEEGFMFNVGSHPDHRGEGLGTAVTVKLDDLASEKGLENVYIGTQPNTDVENFYKAIGCREVFKTKCVEIDLDELKAVQGE